MGIRSFLQTRVGKRRDKDENGSDEERSADGSLYQQQEEQQDDEKDIRAAMEAIQKDLEAAAELYKQPQSQEGDTATATDRG